MNSALDIFADRQVLDVNATDRGETRVPDSSSPGFDAATDFPADQAGTGGAGGAGNIDAPVVTGGVGGIDAPTATGGASVTDGPTATDGRDAPVVTGGVDANDAPVATGHCYRRNRWTAAAQEPRAPEALLAREHDIGTGGATSTGGTATVA